MRSLAEFTGEVSSIPQVVTALSAIRDASAEDLFQPEIDGISAFTRLYTIITQNVLDTVDRKKTRRFNDPDFLTRLDLEFARRYLAAIKAYQSGSPDTPASWSVLFDRRRDQDIRHVNFAACGVNAHVNFDLTFALIETWRDFPPNDARREDYDQVNDIFAEEMDELREDFGAFLAETRDGGILDRFGNFASDLVVRVTRSWAWDSAVDVWDTYDPDQDGGGQRFQNAYARELGAQDRAASLAGRMLLGAPTLP
ncbi:DUF5995 family protein [Pseudonocardia endophytica]|uniref:Uncharacterized protein n=1 Tax=Pseudonocardia endophytica TaxID=401976 RepID=A0A4R1I5A5_PSEEN|nr:DUF5995 family protein [Pseudonocardia endophytica]TCK25212.1 hypothetical protein EV378_1012 [Pseudonocardia endophytica]